MAPGSNLRIVVDGDSTKVYRRGDRVTGRVILATEEKQDITSLRLAFMGTVTTRTTRPFYMTGNEADATKSRRDYEERITLFNFEQELLPRCTLAPKKDSWIFDFRFPDCTTPKYSRWQYGPKYCKDPHPLPPSFRTYTNNPGGQATVAYFLKAHLGRSGSKHPLKIYEMLPYHPTPYDPSLEARVVPRVLYAQTWKPLAEGRKSIDKAFSKLSRRTTMSNNNPRIVPTIHFPERTTPGQHIPILLSLVNSHNPFNVDVNSQAQCELDSVTVSIGTHTTSMCGQPATQPEDAMSKYITCVSKPDMKQPIAFGEQVKLTNDFRLIDDVECVPSFKTYTITRRYDLTVVVGVKYEGRKSEIRCTMALEILPRLPRELGRSIPDTNDAEFEPLPLYEPREPSKELAPDYYSIYSLANTPSISSATSLVHTSSGDSSVASGSSKPTTMLKEVAMDECPVYSP